MSFYYKILVQYDGTGYFGFQWQKDLRTIQEEINLALARLVPGKITTMGASRTDTGVHALGQFVKITSENEFDLTGFRQKFNHVLPQEIRCLEIHASDIAYRPTNDCFSKEYRYLFTNTIGDNHRERRFIANNPYPLNLDAMKSCVAALIGEHSFHNFVSMGSNVKTTIRTITAAELTEVNPKDLFRNSEVFHTDVEKCYQLRIEGNGFLKQMIRHLMTALWKVGNGRITVGEFMEILNGPKKEKTLWKVAHPKGLFLWKIDYEKSTGVSQEDQEEQ